MEYITNNIVEILLAIIAFVLMFSAREQVLFNKKNSTEHAELFKRMAVGSEKFKQVEENKADIKVLDDRVDEHDSDLKLINSKYPYKKID